MTAQLRLLQHQSLTLERWGECRKILENTLRHCTHRVRDTTYRPPHLDKQFEEVFHLIERLEATTTPDGKGLSLPRGTGSGPTLCTMKELTSKQPGPHAE